LTRPNKLQPITGGDWRSIEFKSSTPTPDLSSDTSDDARVGTLGNSIFDIPSHAIRPGRTVLPATAITGFKATTSVSGPASQLALLAASTDYRAMWAAREWSPPDKVPDFNSFAAKPVVRTSDNPTLTKAKASDNWLD